uniref:Uncharacterized protein n=1 Tax=Arundo donax TaxID=35708 RepID=A0A0A8ZEV8_ARUDO
MVILVILIVIMQHVDGIVLYSCMVMNFSKTHFHIFANSRQVVLC